MKRCPVCQEEVNVKDPMKNGLCVACDEDNDSIEHCSGACDDEE